MDKKYRCLGGWITSKSDGDRHFISAAKIAELYGVNPKECIFINPEDHPKYNPMQGYTSEQISKLIDLWPRDDGNYTLPDPIGIPSIVTAFSTNQNDRNLVLIGLTDEMIEHLKLKGAILQEAERNGHNTDLVVLYAPTLNTLMERVKQSLGDNMEVRLI